MPYYDFVCHNGHKQELKLSFAEYDALPQEEGRRYVECDVKYGDLKQPRCPEKALRQLEGVGVGFDMNYGPGGRH